MKPFLKMTFNNGLGDETTIETTLQGVDFDSVMDSVIQTLKGFGFSDKTIDDYFWNAGFREEDEDPFKEE